MRIKRIKKYFRLGDCTDGTTHALVGYIDETSSDIIDRRVGINFLHILLIHNQNKVRKRKIIFKVMKSD
jgi:hypothetical protein